MTAWAEYPYRPWTMPARGNKLADHAEATLLSWLSSGRYRPGDRIPPEHDLTRALGVSRRTLRQALRRLEERGTILRRRGSGTFVGSLESLGPSLDAGLEMFESYTEMARRQGLEVKPRAIRIRAVHPTPEVAQALRIPQEESIVEVRRLLEIDGEPAIFIIASVRRVPELPPAAELRRELEAGRMMIGDVLLEHGAQIGVARAEIGARLVSPDDEIGRALEVEQPTAVLDITETVMDAAGQPVQHSHTTYAPGKLTLHVMRGSHPTEPPAVEAPPAEAGAGDGA